jgi:putative colanic acid biosynthesis UDP-glucose lipid carrier transferase
MQSGGVLQSNASFVGMLARVADAAWIALTLSAALWLYGIDGVSIYREAALVAIVVFLFVAEGSGLYRSWRGVAFRQQIRPLAQAWILTVFVILALGYATKSTGTYSRVSIGLWVLFTPLVLIAFRAAVRLVLNKLRSSGHNTRRVAIAGLTAHGEKLARHIRQTPNLGLKLAGFYRAHESDSISAEAAAKTAPIQGDLEDLVTHAKNNELDLIYIALPLRCEEKITQLITELADTTASVYLVPDLFSFELMQSRWIALDGIPTVSVYETPFYGVDGSLKRIEDVVLSSLILLLIAIPMVFIAIGVKLSSPGPVLFKQTRYGLDGRRIAVWKFRSMTVTEDGAHVPQAQKNDPRVTQFGAFLRATSLDELPQFINVLRGEMSIVGPRPHAVAHNEAYRRQINGYMLRHKVKPGITGWAQINGWRGETDTLDKMEGRIEHDLWYIRSWSVLLDLKIILQTVFRGFVGRNAY